MAATLIPGRNRMAPPGIREAPADRPTPSRTVIWLSSLMAMLAAGASAVGLFSRGGPGEFAAKTVRGQTVQMFGDGVYRYDSLFQGSILRGGDAVVLAVGIPLLIVSIILYARGSLRGSMLLLATLAYFLYTYASLALGAAYNNLFLVYVALFSASLFAFVLLFRSIDLQVFASHFSPRMPQRGPMIFMFVAGVATAVIWLSDVLGTVTQGQPPKHMDTYTTMATYILDLGIITPACLITGLLLRRRAALGYLLAFPLLGIIVLLTPTIPAQTVSQLIVGVSLSPAEIVGPVAGFVGLGLIAIWLMVSLLRNVSDAEPS